MGEPPCPNPLLTMCAVRAWATGIASLGTDVSPQRAGGCFFSRTRQRENVDGQAQFSSDRGHQARLPRAGCSREEVPAPTRIEGEQRLARGFTRMGSDRARCCLSGFSWAALA